MTTRRELLVTIGAGALVAPFASFAQQQGKIWRVGFLSPRHIDFVESDYYYGPFRRGMRELGYVEGKNLKEMLRQEGPYSTEKVIELVTPVLLALTAQLPTLTQ